MDKICGSLAKHGFMCGGLTKKLTNSWVFLNWLQFVFDEFVSQMHNDLHTMTFAQ